MTVASGAPSPGRSSSATNIPIVTPAKVVAANSPIARPPIPPNCLGSASVVIPAAIVTNTIGATSIRIARTNRSPMNATYGAACGHTAPRINPSASPTSTRFHKAIFVINPPRGAAARNLIANARLRNARMRATAIGCGYAPCGSSHLRPRADGATLRA